MVIDLGELPPGRLPAWPDVPPRSRRAGRLWRRRARAVLVVLAVLASATLTKAAAPAGLTAVFTVPAATYTVDADRLYVLDRDDTGYALTAYRLADGGQVWHAPLADRAGFLISAIDADHGGLFLQRSALGGELPQVSELDPATGARRWTSPGRMAGRTADRQLLRVAPVERFSAAVPAVPTQELVAVDRATGAVAWRHRFRPSPHLVAVDAAEGVLVASAPDDTLTVYDITTGRVRASRAASAAPGAPTPVPVVAGPLVLRYTPQPAGPPSLTAFRADTLAPVWTVPVRTDAAAPRRCGRRICVASRDSGPLVALEPDTGTVAWSVSSPPRRVWPSWQQPAGAGLLDPLLHVQITGDSGAAVRRELLVSTASGAQLAATADWSLRPDPDPGGAVAVWAFTRQPGDGLMWAGRLAPDRAGVETIGPVGQVRRCVGHEPYLACEVGADPAAGEVRVWRLR